MKKKRRLFFYCIPPDDHCFAAILARNIYHNLIHYPEDNHVVYPIYGSRIYSSLESKFPKWLKHLQSFARYLIKECFLEKNTRICLSHYLPKDMMMRIQVISAWQWLYALAVSWSSKRSFKSHDWEPIQFINHFKINFTHSGDLVVDTYLRFKGTPKTDLNDWFFADIIWRGHAIENLVSSYFKNHAEYFYFGSYSTYINHGISLRVALSKSSCTAVTFGSSVKSYVIHRKLGSHILPTHAGYHHLYTREDAENLPESQINDAELSLKRRITGSYDSSMSYMRPTISEDRTFLVKSNYSTASGKFILMLHDFFDSPHAYQWLLFPDLWDWAYETISFCANQSIELVVKPHPNQLPENLLIIEKLHDIFSSFESIKWAPKETSNAKLFSECPLGVISAYGSVAAEATYAGIPMILTGDHPGIKFSIANVAQSKRDYFHLIVNPHKIKKGSKHEAILFTALHYAHALSPSLQTPLLCELTTLLNKAENKLDALRNINTIQKIDQVVKQLALEIFD